MLEPCHANLLFPGTWIVAFGTHCETCRWFTRTVYKTPRFLGMELAGGSQVVDGSSGEVWHAGSNALCRL